jgi:peptidyl-prolyl cis-trans isomerase C
MNHRYSLLCLLAPLMLLAACNKNAAPTAAETTERVATVNGKAISKSEFDAYVDTISRQNARQITAEERGLVLDQLINMKLAEAVAEKDGITKDPKVGQQISIARMNVIVDAGLQKWLAAHPVTEEEMKSEYDKQVAAIPREYHTRHIVVDNKSQAEGIIKALKGGADFAKLAQQKSTDSSGKKGGDLDWMTLEAMGKQFADAIAALQPGQITEQPVQSQYGWHVIKLEESRVGAPPAFEDVKERFRMTLQRKKLQDYLEELRKGAQIEKKA